MKGKKASQVTACSGNVKEEVMSGGRGQEGLHRGNGGFLEEGTPLTLKHERRVCSK
jgi:hypothetical protein